MIRTLAIDDEPLALQQLAAYIKKIPYLELVGECQSAIDAHTLMQKEPVDAIFCARSSRTWVPSATTRAIWS